MNRELLRYKFHKEGYCIIEDVFDEEELNTALSNSLESMAGEWWMNYYPDEENQSGWASMDEDGAYRDKISYVHKRSRTMGNTGESLLAYAFLRSRDETHVKYLQSLMRAKFKDIAYITDQTVEDFNGSFLSLYERGCFLSTHSDEFASPAPKLAFVLGLTPKWCSHWGGLTHIESKDYLASLAFFPPYNSLVLFRIPIWHMVSEVSECAPHGRLVMSGWLTAPSIPHNPNSFWYMPD